MHGEGIVKSAQLRKNLVVVLKQGIRLSVYQQGGADLKLVDIGGCEKVKLSYTGESKMFPWGRCYKFTYEYISPNNYPEVRTYWLGEIQLSCLEVASLQNITVSL